MSDCSSNIVTWHNVCDPYNYVATFSAEIAIIYLNEVCVYQDEIIEGETYEISNLNIGINEVKIVYGSTCIVFYIETYYEVDSEIAFNSSYLLLEQGECNPCNINPITNPFATLLLNGDEWINVFINTITDIILVYQNGDQVEPFSVVGNTITLINPTIVCDDASYDVLDSDGNVLKSGSIPSGDNEPIYINDSVATLKDTANNTLSTTNILPEGSEDIIAPDSTITLNESAFTSARSGQTIDIELVDEDDVDVTPISVVGRKITVATPPNYDPRDLVPGDFFTLNWINPLGNNNRFTDDVGGQTYANGIVIDWTTYNIPAATVICFTQAPYAGTGAAATTYFSTLTLGGLSVWKIWEFNEATPLIKDTDQLNYAPFNYVITGATASRVKINSFSFGGDVLLLASSTAAISIGRGAFTTSNRQFGSRITTLAELGL